MKVDDETARNNINKWYRKLIGIAWNHQEKHKAIVKKIRFAEQLFIKIDNTYSKYQVQGDTRYFNAYFLLLEQYIRFAQEKQQETAWINKNLDYLHPDNIEKYKNRLDKANLWHLRYRLQLSLGLKKPAIRSIQQAIHLSLIHI